MNRPALCVSIPLAILVAAAPSAATIGGDDIRVYDPQGTTATIPEAQLAIDWLWGPYAAIAHLDTDPDIHIYRGLDEGSGWYLVHALTDSGPTPDHFEKPDIAVTTGHPRWVTVAHERSGDLEIARAETGPGANPWTAVTIGSMSGSQEPRLATGENLAGDDCVYVVYTLDTGFSQEVRFARSTDAGATFGAPLSLDYLDSAHGVNVDIAVDEGDTLHVVVADHDPTSDEAEIRYLRADNDGASLGDWSFPSVRETVQTTTIPELSIATNPSDNGVLVCVEEDDPVDGEQLLLLLSANRGSIWQTPPGTIDDLQNPALVWTTTGVALGATIDDGSTAGEYVLARPDAGITGSWSWDVMIANPGMPVHPPGVAADDDGEVAMLAILDPVLGGPEPWFDAEWRSDPGFGVSEPGTPVDAGGVINSSPVLSDLLRDGGKDILFTRDDGKLAIYDPVAQGGVTVSVGPTSHASAPAVMDVEDDGPREIFVGNNVGLVYGFDASANPLPGWPVDLLTTDPAWVSCGIVIGRDVVVACDRSIWALRSDGTPHLGFPYLAPVNQGQVVGRAAIGDVDDDGMLEIVAAYAAGVVTIDAAGQVEQVVYSGLPAVSAGVSLADLDDDGDLEIAIPRADGSVDLVHHDGTSYGVNWPYQSFAVSPVGPIAIADSHDNYNGHELHFQLGTGRVDAVRENGTTLLWWGVWTSSTPRPLEPIIDRVGPEDLELVLGGSGGTAQVIRLDYQGDQNGWPRDLYESITVSAASGDIDDDGNGELVIAAGRHLWILDMGVAPAINPDRRWPMAGHNARRNGCANCGVPTSTSIGPTAENAAAFSFAAAPNPSRGPTDLRFTLVRPSHVSLSIYDTTGRLVRSLVDDRRSAGSASVVWNGRDSRGRAVAPGVYFARVVTGDGEGATRKLTILR